MTHPFVIGLDLGTGGARAVAVTPEGETLSAASHLMPPPFMDARGASEQVAATWRVAALGALERCLADLDATQRQGLAGISVDATSGTIVPLDAQDRPLYPGILHNDTRAVEESRYLNDYLSAHCLEVGYQFGPTFALSKVLWLKRHNRLLFQRVHRIAHQADFIVGELTGEFGVSDPSNALKMGYNLVQDRWPAEMTDLGLAPLLPQVVPSGQTVGSLKPALADQLGIPAHVPVIAGVTDSTAGFLATGATRPGEFTVSLGTTLAFKGVSPTLVRDPTGVVYCHRHPGGGWLPGGASNVGGACLPAFFPDRDLAELDELAARRFPSDTLCYPLVEVGERFPFSAPRAEGFFDPPEDKVDQYLSLLQGVALVERWCFERFRELGIAPAAPVFAAGSGAKSDVWNQIRANTLQIPIARSRSTDAAFGSAVLAAAPIFYEGDLARAGAEMTGVDREYTPDPRHAEWAEASLAEVKRRCAERGWVGPEN